MNPRSASILMLLVSSYAMAGPAELVFLAPRDHAMPLTQFRDGILTGGILKDLGDEIARRIGRHARFVTIPSKRVSLALAAGEADGICYVLPQWIDGDFNWTQALIPDAVTIVGRPGTPILHKLDDIADRRVGTVLGYRYPAITSALGAHFRRDDAPNSDQLLAKLLAKRVDYAVLEQLTVSWYQNIEPKTAPRADFSVQTILAPCAFIKTSAVPFADVDRAVVAIASDGTLSAILARYRVGLTPP